MKYDRDVGLLHVVNVVVLSLGRGRGLEVGLDLVVGLDLLGMMGQIINLWRMNLLEEVRVELGLLEVVPGLENGSRRCWFNLCSLFICCLLILVVCLCNIISI